MFCRNCGTVLQTDAKFCVECGTQVVKDSVDKPMASRANGDSSFSSAASSAGEAAQRNKQKERSSHCKSKGKYKKKADETVKVGSRQISVTIY